MSSYLLPQSTSRDHLSLASIIALQCWRRVSNFISQTTPKLTSPSGISEENQYTLKVSSFNHLQRDYRGYFQFVKDLFLLQTNLLGSTSLNKNSRTSPKLTTRTGSPRRKQEMIIDNFGNQSAISSLMVRPKHSLISREHPNMSSCSQQIRKVRRKKMRSMPSRQISSE